MLISIRKDAAVTAEETFSIQLPVGAILKQVSCQNAARNWNKLSIILCTQPTQAVNEQVALLHEAIQAGSRYVTWRGNIRIDSPYIYVLGNFFNCTAGDELWIIVGYEMPEKRGWWC